ncbi:TetR-like C-terminal domain-containing protein [Microbacterium capsulatum]|uniref:TetR-like C-terminal domain-containing protein n=1 Tax=Microbacterium capsulatum TaxID=3041921 RepID=A0ABU0XEM2_9MICO|nr:TetR-like C-terminal domain-containing protein [Microbacterium sp. ASV81]MDQ4213566.1 TetR-like C-terminal domain-containing protein [Microbacterium sp. ASV81]
MPAPQRVTTDALAAAAREIAERDGIDAVTVSAVAAAVGVRPPSLYKHVAHRHDLLRLAADDAARELGADVATVVGSSADPAVVLTGIAHAVRAFSVRAPRAAALLFSAPSPEAGPSASALSPLIETLLAAVRTATAGDDPLPAARTLTAWVYGFCTMEQAGAFQLGGSVDEAFEFGLTTLVGALTGGPRGS